MAIWEKPPREVKDIVQEYIASVVPGHSLSFDRENKLQYLEVESMSEKELSLLVDDLKEKFPDLF